MRVLVFGGTGMLGHKVAQILSEDFETAATVRHSVPEFAAAEVFGKTRLLEGVLAEDETSVAGAIKDFKPDVAVNCIGAVPRSEQGGNSIEAITLNALFPHQLARMCGDDGVRLIHISTDCVFSGCSGPYGQESAPDPVDLYGRSKLLGEVGGPSCLTIRTSLIGRELGAGTGLVEWLISRKGTRVSGYSRALFTGFPTAVAARIIGDIIGKHPDLDGCWHVASEPIAKYDLLNLLSASFGLDVDIQKDEDFVCDRRLDGVPFAHKTGFQAQPWPDMIRDMASDPTPYPSDF